MAFRANRRADRRPAIVAQDYQPIRIEISLHAKALTEPKPGVYVYDFGQNMAGFAHIRAQGDQPARRFGCASLKFSTPTAPSTRKISARPWRRTTSRWPGKGVKEYEPIFTFHGFRYVEVTGLAAKPDISAVTAKVIHTAAPFHTQLTTGSSMLNQLWSNILWGQRSNFVGVPTDCPQRDERLGWTGDAEVFWRTASYNMALAPFSRKFAGDLRGTQVGTPMYGIYAPGTSVPNAGFGAGWSDAGVIVPWTSWLQSGDTRIIDQNWDAMSKYLGAIEQSNPGNLWEHNAGTPFGDWLSPEGQTKAVVVQTAYWAYDVTLMQQMAHATGRSEDEEKYAALHDKIKRLSPLRSSGTTASLPGPTMGPRPSAASSCPTRFPQATRRPATCSRSTCVLCRIRCAPLPPISWSTNSAQMAGGSAPVSSARLICLLCLRTTGTPTSRIACCCRRNILRGAIWSPTAPPPCGSAGMATRCAAIPA